MPDPLPTGPEPTEVPAGSTHSRASSPRSALGLSPGDRVGAYTLREVIGEGGFGVVWLAERREPMVQRVALKIIKPGMDSASVVARFDQERQALAVMDHPNVAKVFDGGVTDRGLPYFVMEHVQGEPITTFCDRHRYTIKQRLELFVPVCEAVQHAHMKGIIHRDLKPGNILVAIRDGRAVPKVIDFGVAKAVSRTLTEKTIFTETGQLIGTPEYMSPEQAEMGALDIDTRADVYSLGVVLYELVAGVLPFDARTLRGKGYAEIQRIIREEEAPRPSTKLTSIDAPTGARIAEARQEARERIASDLRRELEWIPLKAIRKDRTRRYASAEAIAADVRRYIEGQPLHAAPESRWYLARKFVRRNRAQVAAGAAVVLALVGGLGAALWQAREAARQRDEAVRLTGVAESATESARRQTRLAEERLAEVEREKAARAVFVECVELLNAATIEVLSDTPGSQIIAFWELDRRLRAGVLSGTPSVEFVITFAFAQLASDDDAPTAEWDESVFHGGRALALAEGNFGPASVQARSARAALAEYLFQNTEYGECLELWERQIELIDRTREGWRAEEVEARSEAARAARGAGRADWPDRFQAAIDLGRSLTGSERANLYYAYQRFSDALSAAGLTARHEAVVDDWIVAVTAPVPQTPLERIAALRQVLDRAALAPSGRRRVLAALVDELDRLPGGDERSRTEEKVNFALLLARSQIADRLFDEADATLDRARRAALGLPVGARVKEQDHQILVARETIALDQQWPAVSPERKERNRQRLADLEATFDSGRVEAERVRKIEQEASSLNQSAWGVAWTAQASLRPAELGEAVRKAARAVALKPAANHVNTLGVALFRSGAYYESVEVLRWSNLQYQKEGKPSQECDWAFIAMALKRAGRHHEAIDALARYREIRTRGGSGGTAAERDAWAAEVEAEFARQEPLAE